MRTLTREIYKALTDDIKNNEVPGLLMSALMKQDAFVRECGEGLDEATRTKSIIFTTFVRQYNTVVALSHKTPCVVDNTKLFLDLTSIYTLIRSCHERYLCFWYLNTAFGHWNVENEQELQFRWLCFKHGGIVDEERSFNLTAKLRDLTKMQPTLEALKVERCRLFGVISKNSIFTKLDDKTRREIERHGQWRIGFNGSMSWSDLVKASPLHNELGQYEYFQMNQHAHTCSRGLTLLNRINGDINNSLVYLFALASMFAYDLETMLPGSDVAFSDRELALIYEFRQISIASVEIPALDESGEPVA